MMLADTPVETPRSILHYPAEGERFAGAVDYLATGSGLRGWALEVDAPGRPVALLATADGIALTRPVHAMMDRPDIDGVLSRLTQCGFLVGWSRFDRAALDAALRRAPDAVVTVVLAETGEAVPVTFGELTVRDIRRHVLAAPDGDRIPPFGEVADYHRLLDTGLFDEDFYRERYGELARPGMPALLDYLRTGEAAGRRPNFLFDPAAYARRVGLPTPLGALLDYSLGGGDLGGPDGHFDERWYAATYAVPDGRLPLADYLAHRGERSPNPWFDPDDYRAASGTEAADPYRHFAEVGIGQGLFPSAVVADAAEALPPEAAAFMAARRREAATEAPLPTTKPEAPGATRPDAAPDAAPQTKAETQPETQPETKPETAHTKRPATEPAQTQARAAAASAAPRAGSGPPAGRPSPGKPDKLLPAARSLGYDGTEALLEAAPPERRAKILAEADRLVDADGSDRADAALTLAIGRRAAGDLPGAARAAAIYLGETAAGAAEGAAGSDGETVARLLAQTHTLYESGRRREAEEIYRRVFERGNRDYLVVLRLLESAVDRGDVANGATYANLFQERFEVAGNPWAAIALARFHVLRGARRDAVRLLVSLPPSGDTDPVAEAAILNNLVNANAVEPAAKRAAFSAGKPSADLFAAHFRIAVWQQDAAKAAGFLADERAGGLPNWQLGEAMFRLSTPGKLPLDIQHRLMEATFAVLERRGLDDNPVVQGRLHFLLQMKRWTELGALFEALEGRPLGSHRETLLRKLEFYCQSDNTEGAEEIYRAHFASEDLTKWESLTVLRLLGELKRWGEAGEMLLRHVARGYDFAGGGHVAMRIVRKARLHEDVLKAADTSPAAREADLDEFLGLVNEDLTILHRAIALSPKPDATTAPFRGRYRSNWILGGDERRDDEDEDVCVFLCTNQRYFLSALTFLTSFFGQAPQMGGRLFVFLDKDVPRHWHGMLAMVSARFGRVVEVVHEAEFVPAKAEHRVDYGFFSGGGGLSRAAYFRLYAAKYLLKAHPFRRAVYMDTDIICRGDVSGMTALDFGDKLIAAAIEDYTIEVVNAAAKNALDPAAYFNSGVLVLRMDDPRLPEWLDRAIAIAENEPDRLVFHDQCALNIAFENRFLPLPPRYNFYLRPSRDRNGFIEDGVLLHFVDRPKPWDIVFDRTYREEWRVWALMLGTFVPQGLYIDIFSAANRD